MPCGAEKNKLKSEYDEKNIANLELKVNSSISTFLPKHALLKG